MRQIAGFFTSVLRNIHDEKRLDGVREDVRVLCERFPLYPERIRDKR
jgi:glycine/serine hydroxymethyltransferase